MAGILTVKINNQLAGFLEQDKSGKMNFRYDEKAKNRLSLSLPLVSDRIYEEPECRAYFGGLLPENENAKKAIGKKYGINYRNDFSLLKAIGYDCRRGFIS